MTAWSFGTMSEIRVDVPETWRGRIFLTFDVDYAADDVFAETIERVRRAGVPATFMATHATPLLDRVRRDPRFELGVHPDFEALLWDREGGRSAESVLDQVQGFATEAVSVRSHFLTQSSALSDLLAADGYLVESNVHIPFTAGMTLKPWLHSAGHTIAPFGWCDDLAASAEDDPPLVEQLQPDGLNVLIFHPLHVAANTATPEQLERAVRVLRAPLEEVRAAGREIDAGGRLGSRDQLDALLALA